MKQDDSYLVREAFCLAANQAGQAWQEAAYAWMPKGETPSLRDLFAAFALAGHLACPEAEATSDFAAESAYRYADAMMKVRVA